MHADRAYSAWRSLMSEPKRQPKAEPTWKRWRDQLAAWIEGVLRPAVPVPVPVRRR
jgi:hypothetical protein